MLCVHGMVCPLTCQIANELPSILFQLVYVSSYRDRDGGVIFLDLYICRRNCFSLAQEVISARFTDSCN